MSQCPTPETLSRIACDGASGSRFATMEAHVQMCADCQEALERLAADALGTIARGPSRLAGPERPPTIPGFVIEGVLGRGGMGVVYQAWQPHLARRVAIKVVSATIGIGAEDRRRWLREARAIGRVRHRNVVQIHEAGEQDGCLYLVLDLITGGSLAERVTGPLPARVAAQLMAAVARAVDQIHRAGILHLDIKPSNILLDGVPDAPWEEVTPLIADFGIARSGDDPGATATNPIGVGGTPSFMAPEHIAGDRAGIGPRSDVFSLGATLYSLLTGRPPFQAASVIETLDAVRTREPAPPRTLIPGLPRDLETIALTCLRKDPRRRYASAEAVADDLDRWLNGFPIRARPASKLEHAARWCRRRPALALLLAVLALTVVSSLASLLLLWRRSEAERVRAEIALARALESDKATSATVQELVALLTTTVDSPQMLLSERIDKVVNVLYDLMSKARRGAGFAEANLVAVSNLAHEVSGNFRRQGRLAETRVLLLDTIESLESRRHLGESLEIKLAYARICVELARVARSQERFGESLAFLKQAEDAIQSVAHDPRCVDVIVSIGSIRKLIAEHLSQHAQSEAGRQVLASNVGMLDRFSENARGSPAITLLAALARAEHAPDHSTFATLRTAIQRFPRAEPIPELLAQSLADWIANDLNPYPSENASAGESMGRLGPEAHAQSVVRALESRCESLGANHAIHSAAAVQVACIAASRGAEQRRAGHREDARRTAARFSAFAKTLVRKEPDEAFFHVILAMAFTQESKNVWPADDFRTIEENLRDALREACTALRLDPRNREARRTVSILRDKLFGLMSQRPLPR
jgi:eukaryotic-like serine/threonine-protein kinase